MIRSKTLLVSVLLLWTSVVTNAQHADKGLKDYYKNYFPVGVAITPRHLQDSATSAFIRRHFNSLTAENVMKMEPIHPQEDRYNWSGADAIVHFATENGLKVRGHTLCWHNQAPKWMFYDSEGKMVSKDTLLHRLRKHIHNVVGRYKGRIYAWDVVNEAVSDNHNEFLRNSLWYQICGEDFIAQAFLYAHEADPDAVLFYNDYNTESPAKREKIYRLLKKLRDANIPVHAIGLQGHWSIKNPSRELLVSTIDQYASLGIKIQITELDVSVFSNDKMPEHHNFTPEQEQLQEQQYAMLFDTFRKYRDVISGVTFWNVSDRSSWLDNFPVKGRKNYPLLFDENLQPKKAYRKVIDF
ncbi:1,4-beta-xylanase [Chitinophaga sp. SYP-B3965]|uniref:endo-1,4-beta-xylanase n=1 Tax=Chitinophaga sp. SYP-B3965 TaxID=2663120 RepID=UPI001299A246|nr:endo-1,4-beta-xylanase [Chitinophaga sp. SYP-B3965]MRG48048.1 1,4-beta-xylanase [Chitinophaga sp. SYP-B3965]